MIRPAPQQPAPPRPSIGPLVVQAGDTAREFATAFDAVVMLLRHLDAEQLQRLKLTEIAAAQRALPVKVIVMTQEGS